MVEQADVASYLTERLDRPVEIRSLVHTFPGMSRETWIVGASQNITWTVPEGGGGPNYPNM